MTPLSRITRPARILSRLARTLLLLTLVALGTVALMRLAPGFLSDPSELDSRYAPQSQSRSEAQQASPRTTLLALLHADLGRSRQFDLPVSSLIRPRLLTSASLLLRALLFGWLLAFAAALPFSLTRSRAKPLLAAPFTLLLAVPTGALATLALLTNFGGPVLVLTLLVAARDFKFLTHALREAFRSPHTLHARALGLRTARLTLAHILPALLPQLRALASMSLVTALSALVPVEVLFDLPGLGQLAWSAALNRDLPVLLAVTLLMAAVVSSAHLLSGSETDSNPTGQLA